MIELLREGCKRLGVPWDEEKLRQLDAFRSMLEEWNSTQNLVHAEGKELVIKHIFDSLSAYNEIKKRSHSPLVDVGSGAGFPGIPLAIFFRDTDIILIERSIKKCGFLRNVIITLKLDKQVSLVSKTVEELTDKFPMIVFRALGDFRKLFPILKKNLKEGGYIIAYKGKRSIIEDEIKIMNPNLYSHELIKVEVPFLKDDRHLLVIKKNRTNHSF